MGSWMSYGLGSPNANLPAYVVLLSGGMGLIDSVNTLSLPQIVIDGEIAGMIRRLLGEVEFSPQTMARETIERVGIGGNFLREKETRRRIRAGEHFVPLGKPVRVAIRESAGLATCAAPSKSHGKPAR